MTRPGEAQFDPSEFDPEDDDLLVLDCLTGKIASRWDSRKSGGAKMGRNADR